MARPPPLGVGAEDSSMMGGISSQRIEMGFNPLSARLMHQEHLSRVFHGGGSPGGSCGGDSARKLIPGGAPGIGDGKVYGAEREHFIQSSERHFNSGNSGMLSSIEREEGSVDREGQRMVNGSTHVSSSVNMPARVPEWAENERTGGMVAEEDYRDLEERGGASNASQSEASEEEEEESGGIDGEVESTGQRGVNRMVNHGLSGEKGYESLSHAQLVSIGGSHESMAGLQTSEGFQKARFERERASKVSTSSAPSLGMFLSPSSTIPFLSSFTSSPSEGHMLGHTESSSVENGTTTATAGLGTPSGYFRDDMRKDTGVSRDIYVKEGQNVVREQGRAAHSTSIHEAMPRGPVTQENENYYPSLVSSSGIPQNDPGNQIVAFGHRKSNETMEMHLRSALTDPITGALMDDATILSCGHSFGSNGLRRVFETNTCITCGAAAKREDMTPNHALRSVVQAFRREQEIWKENKSVKRRRYRPDQNRQNSGELTTFDVLQGRVVQFPFKVNDRVVIQGNKRTPERFVGRDAVITTQCLNGWFVVRTLDNGESVKLQYRSLRKMGDQPSPDEPQPKIIGPTWL